jgi:hypothetical protein
MSPLGRLGERLRGSRIDDHRPAHISASPETGRFGSATTLAPSPASTLLRTLAPMR